MSLSAADFSRISEAPDGLWRTHVAITKSDATAYDPPLRGLLVLGAGNVACKDLAGNNITYTGVPAGTFLPGLYTAVMSTNTTATNIVSGY